MAALASESFYSNGSVESRARLSSQVTFTACAASPVDASGAPVVAAPVVAPVALAMLTWADAARANMR